MRKTSFENVEKLFSVLGINLTYSLENEVAASSFQVPMLGYVAAGGDDIPDDVSISFIAEDPDGTNDNTPKVPAPPHFYMAKKNDAFALTVRGSSAEPVYRDGDVVFAHKDDPARATPEKLIRRKYLVTLDDGSGHLKIIRRPDSGIEGECNLESINPRWPTMKDQHVVQAYPIRHVTKHI